MTIKKLIHQARVSTEHQLKNLGLYTGIAFGFLSLGLWYADVAHFQGQRLLSAAQLERLTSLNTALAGILIGILMTTFSVVFVVMQLASSQFSPRILRHFMYSDVRIQQFMGLFLGAIGWIFLPQVFATIGPSASLPLSTVLATVLAFYCLLVSFPRVIAHLSDNMNVAAITHRVKNEVIDEVELLYGQPWQQGDRLLYKRVRRPADGYEISFTWQGMSGYLSEVNYAEWQEWHQQLLAAHTDWPTFSVYQKPIVGEFIMAQTTELLVVSFEQPISETLRTEVTDKFAQLVTEVFNINKYRSYTQDINFGVRKLVDIAIKAISPAVNDPTTCLNCIDHLAEIVRYLATKHFPSAQAVAMRKQGIYVNEFNFDELVDFCFGQIYQWGKHDPVVVKRVLSAIKQILPYVNNPYHLGVLVKEVEDMELHRLYDPTLLDRAHTHEQILSIQKERRKFRQKAIERINALEASGLLTYYAPDDDTHKPLLEEVHWVQFLRNYRSQIDGL